MYPDCSQQRRSGCRFVQAERVHDSTQPPLIHIDGSGQETVLSETGNEESPSFAPNSRWVMFATHAGDRDSLVAVTVDGRVRQRLTSSAGDIREPTWGPFPR